MTFLRTLVVAALLASPAAAAPGAAEDKFFQGKGGVGLDVPYVATPDAVVQRMLKIANTGPTDVQYDLGCGDGRLVIAAARDFKVRKAVGIDLDPDRITEANANAAAAGVTDRVKFIQGDLFQQDFHDVTVLTLFLLPQLNLKLRPVILDQLKPGTRVVSHAFTMGDWPADKHEKVEGRNIYYWVVPAKVAGTWQLKAGPDSYKLALTQHFQTIEGTITAADGNAAIAKPALSGTGLRFDAAVGARIIHVRAKVKGDAMSGTLNVAGKPVAFTAKRVAAAP